MYCSGNIRAPLGWDWYAYAARAPGTATERGCLGTDHRGQRRAEEGREFLGSSALCALCALLCPLRFLFGLF